MNMYGNSDEGSSGHDVVKTPADLQRQIQQNKEFLGNIQLKPDEKTGDSYVLGMRVPKNMRPIIEFAIENAKPYIVEQSGNIYKNSTQLAGKLGFKSAHATKVGVVAENTFRWGIIGLQPIYGIVHASQTYARERKELFKEFSPIISASRTDYKKNEVIKSAFNRIHDDWITNLKMLAADIPTLIPMVILGRQDQVAAKKKRESETPKQESVRSTTKEIVAEKRRQAREQVEFSKAIEQEIAQARQEHINENFGKSEITIDEAGNTRKMTRQELVDDFNENYAYSIRYAMRENRDNRTQHTPDKDSAEAKNEKMSKFFFPIASLVSQVFKINVEDAADKRRKNTNAWKLMHHLKQEVDTQLGDSGNGESQIRSADDIRITLPESKGTGEVSLKQYIVEVFKQNELDNGRTTLGNNLVKQLQPAVDMIADHIADGSLDVSALLKLVGENQVIIHEKSSRRFASVDQVEKAIAELVPVLSTHENIKVEDFLANFADPELIKKIVKGNLDTMKGAERAFFASLFPDSVLEQAGVKTNERNALRKEIHERKYGIVAACIAYIAKHDQEQLTKWGLTDEQIEVVKEFASKLEDKDAKAIEAAVDGRDKTIIAAIRTVGLNQQATKTGDAEAMWRNRIKESEPIRTELAEAKKHQKEDRESENADRHRKLLNRKSPDEKFADRVSRGSEMDEPSGSLGV